MFAIALAVHLALGDDVASLKFDQPRMREHLYKCLHQKKMTGFLQCAQTTARRTPRLRRTYIEICRNCFMPEECDDTVRCQNCEDWFHVGCLQHDLPQQSDKWRCDNCKNAVTTVDDIESLALTNLTKIDVFSRKFN